MESIHFNTIVGDDQVIRIPEGVVLPPGPLHVTVTACTPEPVLADVISICDHALDAR